MTNNDLWHTTLSELRLQMTTATFNTWLVGSKQISLDDNELTIGVQNAYALDWLQTRFYDTVLRVVTAVGGHEYKIKFVVVSEALNKPAADLAPFKLEPPPAPPEFPGFEPIRSNFTQVPRQFFEVVLRSEPSVVVAFIAAVVDQTYGVIVNYHTAERREWWEASNPEIGRACGVKSLASVGKAIRISREHGYVIRDQGKRDFRYRLRRFGETLDASIKK